MRLIVSLSSIGFVSPSEQQAFAGVLLLNHADIDNDGDIDLLTLDYPDEELDAFQVSWYENVNGRGGFGEPSFIDSFSNDDGPFGTLNGADIDTDGDVDVVVFSHQAGIIWYENIDGHGEFGPASEVAADLRVPWPWHDTIRVSDVDADGDMDILSASDLGVAWHENTDSKGAFSPPRIIAEAKEGAYGMSAADFDGDGDVDVVSWTRLQDGSNLAWYENTDGKGAFGDANLVTHLDGAGSTFAADVDGDRDNDLVVASSSLVAWHENTDGLGTFGPRQEIMAIRSVEFALVGSDVDGDGDIDVFSQAGRGHKVVWHENVDGRGRFANHELLDVFPSSTFFPQLGLADLDGDNDLDVLAKLIGFDADLGTSSLWVENRLAGDIDDDGVVDFADFLRLSANFDDVDAAWKDGDFDQNGRVEFADFLILAANFGNTRPQFEP